MSFSNLLSQPFSLAAFFGKKAKSFLGVDIGSSAIKIVELKKDQGRIALQTYGEVALGPYANQPVGARVQADPDMLAQALIDVMAEAHVTTPMGCVAVQSSASLVFLLTLPESALSSLDSVVPNEARKYIPVPLSEVALNWQVVPAHIQHRYDDEQVIKPASGDRQVLVVAIRNDALSGYRNIMGQAKLDIKHMEIEAFSSLRSIYRNELTPFALVDIGASQVRVAIVHYGMIMQYDVNNRASFGWSETLARSLNVSFEKAQELKHTVGLTQTIPNVAEALGTSISTLESDIRNSISRYERAHTTVVDRMVLVGGGSRMPGLVERLGESFDIKVEQAHPFDKAAAPQFLDPVLDSVGPEFATAVGAALGKLA